MSVCKLASVYRGGRVAERYLLRLQSVFLTYGAMAPESAALAAELLGFDPELVVPQLSVRAKSG